MYDEHEHSPHVRVRWFSLFEPRKNGELPQHFRNFVARLGYGRVDCVQFYVYLLYVDVCDASVAGVETMFELTAKMEWIWRLNGGGNGPILSCEYNWMNDKKREMSVALFINQ